MTDYSKMKKVDKKAPIQDRVGFLRYCADLYETDGISPISDAHWDEEYAAVKEIVPNDAFFTEVGGIDLTHVYGAKVKHDVTCGSLNKSPNTKHFLDWFKKTYSKLTGKEFIIEFKIDGLSLCLHYENGELVQALQRGDGITGVDVTANAQYVRGVRKNIKHMGKVEIRGECYKNRKDFYDKWHKLGKKNPRNFAAGSMNQKDPLETKKRGLDFIAYEIVQKDFDTQVDKVKFLLDNGFSCLAKSSKKLSGDKYTHEQIARKVQSFMDTTDRASLPFDIDGVVVKLNDVAMGKTMGFTDGGKRPKSNRAVKFPPEQKETVLRDVEWDIGKTGALTIVGIIDPIELAGTVVQRVTLHNLKDAIERKGLSIGCRILVEKAGDIIPKIVKLTAKGNTPIVIPDDCVSCGHKLEWDDTNTTKFCSNLNCLSQLNRKIRHWLVKLGVKGIGMGTIEKLTDKDVLEWEGEPIISSLSELYYKLDNDRDTEHPFRKYEMLKQFFGDKSYDNILKSLRSVSETTLDEFIQALGIANVGRTAKDIVDIAPTIEDVDKLDVATLEAVSGFGDVKAQGFVSEWKEMRDEIETLLKYVKIEKLVLASTVLTGQSFCFTGSFSKPRNEYQKMVSVNGGTAASSVGKGTILVWDGEEQGNKYNKAISGKNKIISEEDFNKMLA